MGTKVQNIKIHDKGYTTFDNEPYRKVQVVEAKLVLVNINKGSMCWMEDLSDNEKKFIIAPNDNAFIHEISNGWKIQPFTPILISKTEKIEIGDWFLSSTGVIMCFDKYSYAGLVSRRIVDSDKKILALPEHFSPEQLQQIVDGELKDGDKVLVECEDICLNNIPLVDHTCTHKGYKIKLNSSNHITIYKTEEKMYTKEEMIKHAFDFYFDLSLKMKVPFNKISENRTNTLEWFEQNVK